MGRYTLFWVLFCMAFSIFVTYMETRARTEDMDRATKHALYEGLRSGCDEIGNPIRKSVQRAISNIELLDIERGEEVQVNPVTGQTGYEVARETMDPINCEAYARHRVNFYETSSDVWP